MIKSAISFLLGCVLLLQLTSLPDSHYLWLLIPALIFIIFPNTRWLAFVVLGFFWSYYQATLLLNDRLSLELQGQDLVITGTVHNVPEFYDRRIRFEFKPDQDQEISLPSKILLNWYQPFTENIHADERWQLNVRLKQPYGMKNPGTFDYESWLFQQSIGATGYIRNNKQNKRIENSSFISINKLRQSLFNKINLHLNTSEHKGLVQGLTTGIRHNINQDQWQLLRLSGTSHLLAISGLHIGLAAAIGFFSFRWLWSRRAKNLLFLPALQIGAIGGFILALFYAAMAGFSIPTQRALLMVSVVMISLLIKRPVSIPSTLAVSLFVILIWNPLSALSAGLWLSFSAVAVILFTCQYRFPKPQWQWAKIHVLIALGLTPLLLVFFLQISFISPIANIIAVPFISLIVVPLLLLSIVLLCLYEPLGFLLLDFVDLILTLFWPFLDTVVSLPFSHWTSAQIPLLYLLPIVIGIVLLLAPKAMPGKHLAVFGLLPLFFYSPPRPNNGEFWFTLLDVGQGLAVVVQTQHHILVFDSGPKFSDNFNTGTAIVLPFLQSQGINHIDSLIISHGDNDHIGGALPLIEAMPVNTIITSAANKLPKAVPCLANHSWQWDQVDFRIFLAEDIGESSTNNQSCVLQVKNAAGSVLLSGDIEKLAEIQLVKQYGTALKSTVLIAPHHGSNTSSTDTFIDTVNPEVVLFPIGYRNRYHFPHDKVVQRYIDRQISMLNTADHGAIQYHFGLGFYSEPVTWRQHAHKIWTSATTD
jgi:competence protein ComEC